MSEFNNKIAEETNLLMHEFVNNSTHPDYVVVEPHFRELVDHLMNNGQDLKGFYQHMVWRGHVPIEEDEFNDLIGKITNLSDEIRKWCAERIGKCVRFVTISHGVWDGKRKKTTRPFIIFHASRNTCDL